MKPNVAILSLILLNAGSASAEQTGTAKPPQRGCADPHAREFDFWVGEWNVTSPDGKAAGHSRIESILDGCGISEHWQGAGGTVGVSYNAWDAKTKSWRQFWIDVHGDVLLLDGGWSDGHMRLQHSDGQRLSRITWTPNADGSVRQLWDTSADGGRQWKVEFDGLYRKAQ